MYIEAVDGKYYSNITIILSNDCYIRCIDCGSPELIVNKMVGTKINDLKNFLKEKGINGKILGKTKVQDKFPFPPIWDRMINAYTFNINLRGPIPIPNQWEHETDQLDALGGEYLAWSMIFDAKDIYSLLIEKAYRPSIINFLMKRIVLKSEWDSIIDSVKKKIIAQYPGIIAKFRKMGTAGEKIKLIRK